MPEFDRNVDGPEAKGTGRPARIGPVQGLSPSGLRPWGGPVTRKVSCGMFLAEGISGRPGNGLAGGGGAKGGDAMDEDREAAQETRRPWGRGRGGFELLALSLFASVFLLLFLGLALFNSRRLQETLVQVQVNKAVSIMENVAREFEELLARMSRMEELYDAFNPGSLWGEAGMSAHEALATALIDLARDLDLAQERGALDTASLAETARRADIRALAFLDGRGDVLHESAPIPEEVLRGARDALERGEGVSLALFPSRDSAWAVHHVVLRRGGGSGAVVLVLGEEELGAWRIRASLQEALEVAAGRRGVLYIAVEDPKGEVLAQTGEAPRIHHRSEGLVTQGEGSGIRAVRREGDSGTRVIEIVMPFRAGERHLGEAHIGLDAYEMDDLLGRNRLQIYISSAMMMLLALLAVGLLYRNQGRHHARLQQINERLHQAERLSSLGRLAAVVAHEVRNPLNAISMAVQRVGREFAPPEDGQREEFSRMNRVIREEIQRINRIVEEFLGLTRKGDLRVEEVKVGEILDRLQEIVQPQAAASGVRLTVSGQGGEPQVLVDRDRIMQALVNLANNALEAMSQQGGTLTLGCRCEGRDRVFIEISDTGRGMCQEEIQRIFDPGYSTKDTGLGLGLHIAREIVRLHGGEISVRSKEGEGTTFAISLPCRRVSRLRQGEGS